MKFKQIGCNTKNSKDSEKLKLWAINNRAYQSFKVDALFVTHYNSINQ